MLLCPRDHPPFEGREGALHRVDVVVVLLPRQAGGAVEESAALPRTHTPKGPLARPEPPVKASSGHRYYCRGGHQITVFAFEPEFDSDGVVLSVRWPCFTLSIVEKWQCNDFVSDP